MRKRNRFSTRNIALCGLLTAMMLVLGFIESLLPVATAVPGVKLGLSNGVLMFALYMLDAPTAFLLMLLKVVLSGLLFGGVSAMMYAMAGGVAWAYYRFGKSSLPREMARARQRATAYLPDGFLETIDAFEELCASKNAMSCRIR